MYLIVRFACSLLPYRGAYTYRYAPWLDLITPAARRKVRTKMNNKTNSLSPELMAFYREAQDDQRGFWEKAALDASPDIHWFRKWKDVFVRDYPSFKWYVNGLTNVSYNCLEQKIQAGHGNKAAFIFEAGDTGERSTITYLELLELVKKYAAALRGTGVRQGDRVAIYMPMSIEAAACMLACARIGAIHMVIFAGFSPGAIADRLALSGSRFVITQARNMRRNRPVLLKEMMDEAIERLDSSEQVRNVIVLDRGAGVQSPMRKGRDIDWDEFLEKGRGCDDNFVELEANQPLFLLPTSGTTAKPKITVQNHGGYQVYCYSMGKWVYGLKPNDIWFATSDIGWIVGHSYCIYGPLLTGCTSLLYEGTPDYPQKDMWWAAIERNHVTGMFTSPTGVRSLMRYGVEQPERRDLSSLERVVVAGEVLNPEAWDWLQNQVLKGRIPVIDNMWQTETSGPIIANPYGLGLAPIKPGSAGFPVPGIGAEIVNEKDGEKLPANTKGVLVLTEPFPGLTPALWGEPDRYTREYWEAKPGTMGKYYAGDAAHMDEDGYVWFAGRADEVIKIASHRIGTIEIENSLVAHPAVIEAAVTGVPDQLRGEVASALVVLSQGYQASESLKEELVRHVRKDMGPIVVVKDIVFVNMMPKTRSGKIMRRVIKAMLTNSSLGDISTIEEEGSVDEIRRALQQMREVIL